MKALGIQFDESIPAWEKAIYAFLAEKERRSGSRRTVDAYTRTLQRFFGTLGRRRRRSRRQMSSASRTGSVPPGVNQRR